jgi:hypothetical protein
VRGGDVRINTENLQYRVALQSQKELREWRTLSLIRKLKGVAIYRKKEKVRGQQNQRCECTGQPPITRRIDGRSGRLLPGRFATVCNAADYQLNSGLDP